MLFFADLTRFSAAQVSEKRVCNPDSDGLILDGCLKPFEKQWNVTKKSKPQLEMLTVPLLMMDKKDMGPLCDIYHQVQDNCSSEMVACNHHQLARFALKNFDYACQMKSDFRKESDCLWTTIANNPQCSLSLKKVNNVNDCKQVSAFYKCIEPFIQMQCKTKGMAALVHALDHFGCDTILLDEGNTTMDTVFISPWFIRFFQTSNLLNVIKMMKEQLQDVSKSEILNY